MGDFRLRVKVNAEEETFLRPEETITRLDSRSVISTFGEERLLRRQRGGGGGKRRGFVSVMVTSVQSPKSFHCIFEAAAAGSSSSSSSSSEALSSMTAAMTSYYNSPAAEQEANLTASDFDEGLEGRVLACAFRSGTSILPGQHDWCRVVVLKVVAAEEYSVRFVDSGKTQVVHRNYLRLLRRDFANALPAQAVLCSLAGVKPRSSSWSPAVKRRFISQIKAMKGQFITLVLDSKSIGKDDSPVPLILVHANVEEVGHPPPPPHEKGEASTTATTRSRATTRSCAVKRLLCVNEMVLEVNDGVLDDAAAAGRRMEQVWKSAEQDIKHHVVKRRNYLAAFGEKRLALIKPFAI